MSSVLGKQRSLHDFSFEELQGQLVGDGLNANHAHTLWRSLHGHADTLHMMPPHFLGPLRRWLETNLFSEDAHYFVDVPENSYRDAQQRWPDAQVLTALARWQNHRDRAHGV